MSFHELLIALMAVFAALGALDRAFGGRLGLGDAFAEGVLAMGSLALAMVGVVCLAPVLAAVLRPLVVPVFRLLGADPAMFAGTILACDMGGASLARALTADPQAAALGGILTGSTLGATVVFTLPVALGILRPQDRPALAQGVLCGVVTIPLGILAGGLAAGFGWRMVLGNLSPIVLIAALVALGLWRWENGLIRLFAAFGKGVVGVITLGLGAAIVEALTGFAPIPGMAPLSEGIRTVGDIAAVLAGAFPLVKVVTKLLRRPLTSLGNRLGIGETGAAGLIAALANAIAAFGMVRDMNRRGQVVTIAFSVSAAFALGDHLAFAAGYAPEMLAPMLITKLTAGVTAIVPALYLTRGEGGVGN